MNTRSLLAVFCVASACLFIAAPAGAQSSKKKPKEIVVVGSKVKDVVRDPGVTEETSLNPPALDDRNFDDLVSEKKKGKESDDSSNASFAVEREMKESGEKGAPAPSTGRSVKPAPAQSSRARIPAKNKRPSGAKKKKAPETEED
jgi:hypothetical protein